VLGAASSISHGKCHRSRSDHRIHLAISRRIRYVFPSSNLSPAAQVFLTKVTATTRLIGAGALVWILG
jgi:hypothetical protein